MDLQAFKNYLLVNGSSQASVKIHTSKIESFFRQYPELNQENLNSFLASKVNKWTGASFNLFINSVSHYAKFLKLSLELPQYHKVDKRVKEYITEKEIEDIISKVPVIFQNSKKTQAILNLMFSTGLRPKEIIQLKRSDFNFQEKVISIKNTKTFKDRTVALSDELCKLLPVVFSHEAEQINAFNINHTSLTYMFNRINEVMGLKVKLSPYSMRRSFAHNLISKGIKLTSLQSTMGHTNPLTTLGYLNVSEKEAQDEVRKLINKRRK